MPPLLVGWLGQHNKEEPVYSYNSEALEWTRRTAGALIGWLVMIGIIVYPFVWLHEKPGWVGIGTIGVFVIGGGIFWSIVINGVRVKLN